MSLKRFFQNLWHRKVTTSAPRATLAIENLPQRLDALPSTCNTALWGQDIPAMRIWQYSVLREMLVQAPVLVLAPDAQQAQAIANQPDFAQALRKGHLKIWILSDSDQQKIAKSNGFFDFLLDLNAVGLKPNHALLCLDLFPIFHYTALEHLSHLDRLLRQWARKRQQPSVWFLLFRGAFQPSMERRSFLSHAFPYAATLQMEHQGLSLHINRWNSAQGAVFQTRYGLEPEHEASPRLRANGSMVYMHDSQQTIVAADLPTVYTTQACVPGIRLLPPNWIVLPNWESLEQACQSAIAATVLIDAGTSDNLKALATLVHRLRITHPASFKIAVKETSDHLRVHTEEALAQLGINTVIYKGSQFSRTVRRLTELQHTWFYGKVPESVDEILDALTPIAEYGYHSPEKFCHTLRNFLENPLRAHLSHSLVHLHLLPTVSHTMALQQLKISRPGELFTNYSREIVIFLYACREADMDNVLSRIFQSPIESIFQSQESFHLTEDINHDLIKMQISLQKLSLPDYSMIFEKSNALSLKNRIKEDNNSTEEIKKEFPLSINSKNKKIYHNKRTEWVQSNKEVK